MREFGRVLAILLTVLMGFGAPMDAASGDESLLTQIEIDEALRRAMGEEESTREEVRSFLQREDVRRLAREAGLGVILEKAVAAVDTLEPGQLEQVSAGVTDFNDELAGGLTITVSLVALLLIIIIIILLVD